MPINTVCPSCESEIKQIPDKFAGKTGKCPNCQAKVEIPVKSDLLSNEDRARKALKDDALSVASWVNGLSMLAAAVVWMVVSGMSWGAIAQILRGTNISGDTATFLLVMCGVAGLIAAMMFHAVCKIPTTIIRLLVAILEKK